MAKITNLIFLFSIVSVLDSAKLPSSFTKCDRKKDDFNKCLSSAIQNAIEQLKTPIKEVGLPSLEPLVIPALTIDGGSGAVQFRQNYKDMKVSGITTITSFNASMDFEKNIMKLELKHPWVKLEFEYEVSGKILVLPIKGKGPGQFILDKPYFSYTFALEEYEKKGKKYYKVVKTDTVFDPEKIIFTIENLFDGNKELGDNINKMMNENWKDIFGDVQASYEEAFGQIYSNVFNNLLKKVSISELFDN